MAHKRLIIQSAMQDQTRPDARPDARPDSRPDAIGTRNDCETEANIRKTVSDALLMSGNDKEKARAFLMRYSLASAITYLDTL